MRVTSLLLLLFLCACQAARSPVVATPKSGQMPNPYATKKGTKYLVPDTFRLLETEGKMQRKALAGKK